MLEFNIVMNVGVARVMANMGPFPSHHARPHVLVTGRRHVEDIMLSESSALDCHVGV